MSPDIRNRIVVILFVAGFLMILFSVAWMTLRQDRDFVMLSVDYTVLHSQTGFFCLGHALIYAPDGLEVFGSRPDGLHECSPDQSPLAGSWRGRNFLIRPIKGWHWEPVPNPPHR